MMCALVVLTVLLLVLCRSDGHRPECEPGRPGTYAVEEDVVAPCSHFYGYCRHRPPGPNAGRRVAAIPPQRMNSTVFAFSQCYCDDQCHRYGDCCPDRIPWAGNATDTAVPESVDATAGLKWECQNIPFQMTWHRYFYTAASCPEHYGSAAIVQRCLRNVSRSDYDYTLDLPVLSLATNITYANVYCAICNGDTQLKAWRLRIVCSPSYPNCSTSVASWQYVPGARQWRLDPARDEDNHTTDAYFEIDEDDDVRSYYTKYGARRCRHNVVRSCPGDWKGEREQRLCASHALYVTSAADRRTYKNAHCAACHGQSPSQLRCAKGPQPMRFDFCVAAFDTQPYSILMKFSGSAGDAPSCRDGDSCRYGEICDAGTFACQLHACQTAAQCIVVYVAGDRPVPEASVLEVECGDGESSRRRLLYHDVNATGRLYSVRNHNGTAVWACPDVSPVTSSQAHFTTACLAVSLLCLTLHIAVRLLLPQLRNVPNDNLLCFALSLFAAQGCFLFSLEAAQPRALCVAVSVAIHYGFLASFFWMNVIAVDVYGTFANNPSHARSKRSDHVFLKYSLYAWIAPLAIVVAAAFADFSELVPDDYRPRYGRSLCFFNNRSALLVFFTVPQAALTLANVVLFAVTVNGICRATRAAKIARQSSSARNTTQFLLYAKLGLIMGLTWIFGFLANVADYEPLWYLYTFFNALAGAFIFAAFSCKRKVYRMLRRKTWLSGTAFSKSSSFSTTGSTRFTFIPFRATILTVLLTSKKDGRTSKTTDVATEVDALQKIARCQRIGSETYAL